MLSEMLEVLRRRRVDELEFEEPVELSLRELVETSDTVLELELLELRVDWDCVLRELPDCVERLDGLTELVETSLCELVLWVPQVLWDTVETDESDEGDAEVLWVLRVLRDDGLREDDEGLEVLAVLLDLLRLDEELDW